MLLTQIHVCAGKWSQLRFYSTSSWRISYSTGDTGFYIQNGFTSMSTVSIMSELAYKRSLTKFIPLAVRSSIIFLCQKHSYAQCLCRYATPFGLTSEYAHPAEILFLGFATILGPAITGPHLITLWLWMVLRVLETVEAHCGYHFPWSLSNYLPLYGGFVCSYLFSFEYHEPLLFFPCV